MSFDLKTELELIQNRAVLMSEEAVSDFDSATELKQLDFALMGGSSLALVAEILDDIPAVKTEITDKAALKDLLVKVGDDLHRGYNEAVESHFN